MSSATNSVTPFVFKQRLLTLVNWVEAYYGPVDDDLPEDWKPSVTLPEYMWELDAFLTFTTEHHLTLPCYGTARFDFSNVNKQEFFEYLAIENKRSYFCHAAREFN